MKRFIKYLLLVFGALLVVNLFIVPVLEPGMLYFPTKEIEQYPSSVGLEYEDIYLKTEDGMRISGWYVENKASKKVILFFHGNGGNLGSRVSLIKLLHALPANIFIIDYHGFGKSQGRPSEKNLYLDAEAAYKYLREQKKYEPSQIIVMGSSLGTAIAVHLAAQEKVGGLILQKAFTSARAMASRMNPLYRWPIIWIRSDFNNLKMIQKVNARVLLIHSKDDEMIPYKMSMELYEKANEPKNLLLLQGYSHNDFVANSEYLDGLRRLVEYQ